MDEDTVSRPGRKKRKIPRVAERKSSEKSLLLYSFITPDFLFHGHFIHWWIVYQKNQIFHYRMSQKRFKALISCSVFKKKVPIILLIIICVVCFIILTLSVCAVNASVHIMSPTLLQIPPHWQDCSLNKGHVWAFISSGTNPRLTKKKNKRQKINRPKPYYFCTFNTLFHNKGKAFTHSNPRNLHLSRRALHQDYHLSFGLLWREKK